MGHGQHRACLLDVACVTCAGCEALELLPQPWSDIHALHTPCRRSNAPSVTSTRMNGEGGPSPGAVTKTSPKTAAPSQASNTYSAGFFSFFWGSGSSTAQQQALAAQQMEELRQQQMSMAVARKYTVRVIWGAAMDHVIHCICGHCVFLNPVCSFVGSSATIHCPSA